MNDTSLISEMLVENLTDDQLDELMAYTPAFTSGNLTNIKTRTFEKINMPVISKNVGEKFFSKRIFVPLAAAIMLFIMSTAVLAAVIGFDFGNIINSFFNNPATDSVIVADKTIVNSGIEITLLSAYTDGTHVYAMIAMRDLEAERIGENMLLLFGGANAGSHAVTTPIIYDQAQAMYLLGIELMNISPYEIKLGDYISFSIEYILFDVMHDAKYGEDMLFYLGDVYFNLLSSTVGEVLQGPWNFTFAITAKAESITFSAEINDSQYFGRFYAEISHMVTTIRFVPKHYLSITNSQELMQRMGENVWNYGSCIPSRFLTKSTKWMYGYKKYK